MDLSKLRKIFGERLATSEAIRRQHSHDESWHVPISLPDAVIFPENTKEGFKTEALPSIWENKDEFNALMQKASDDMLKLAKAIDTADDLRAIQKELMWSNCSACHNRFRAEH